MRFVLPHLPGGQINIKFRTICLQNRYKSETKLTIYNHEDSNKNVTTTQLALMTAAAVISLRGLPMMAQEELTMFFYIFFATFLFLIPAALVGAELGSAFASKGGGVYTWVKEAFNQRRGSRLFSCSGYKVVWYPTVLGFAAASIAYMIGLPDLAQNGMSWGYFSIVPVLGSHVDHSTGDVYRLQDYQPRISYWHGVARNRRHCHGHYLDCRG